VLSLALLGVILMRAWDSHGAGVRVETARQGSIAQMLSRWSVSRPSEIHLVLDSVLPPYERDWLGALERAGTVVSWSGERLPATAVTLTRIADPAGASELSATVPAQATVSIRDGSGVIDTVTTQTNGVRLEIPGARAGLGISVAGTTAWAAVPDSILFKRVLVEGAAGWETKFTIAALTERGWKVDAISHVAPGMDVREGTPGTPDTSRYAAVIAVDSTATLIARGATSFVRSGGGLITLRDAATLGPSSTSSVLLERRPDGEVRASRVGNGRIIRVGYNDLWRMRMRDDDTIPDPAGAHRAWLARAVAAVAYAPAIAAQPETGADPAPLADMVNRIGARSMSPDAQSPLQAEVPSSALFGVLLLSLLVELVSRRMRGAR
jgi:hypothetical protein